MLLALVMLSVVLALFKAIYVIDWSWWVIWMPALCSLFVVLGAVFFSFFAVLFVDPFKVTYR